MKKQLLIISFFVLTYSMSSFAQVKNKSPQKYKDLYQKVMNHYKYYPKKREAAQFLLKGMLVHGSAVPYWTDKSGKTVNLDEFQYDSFEEAKVAFGAFARKGGKQQIKYIKDIDQVDAEFLIDNIDYSFKIWEQSPWHISYSFRNFCEYVLPYRSSKEPLEKGWKQNYADIYKSALFTASDTQDPVEVCSELIKSLKHIEFIAKRDYPQPMLSIDQVRFRGQGNCTDLANSVLLLGRSLGLAVTYDFTPHHAASSNSHYWNTVLDKDGYFIPFNGNGELPYVYNANGKRLGKVLRYTFSAQKNTLARLVPPEQIPSSKLRSANIIDVTEEYVSNSNMRFTFKGKVPNNIGYITVFNKGKWRPIWWGKTDPNNNVVFKKMGRNIVYLAAKTKDTIVRSKKYATLDLAKYPLLLDKNGQQHLLLPNFKSTFKASVSRSNESPSIFIDYNPIEFLENKYYSIYCWNDKWQLVDRKKCSDKRITFEDLPKNALFRITPDDPDGFERIFLLDDKTQKITWY